MATPLDGMLERWQQAGLIDAEQRLRISDFEAASPSPSEAPPTLSVDETAPLGRPSGTELLSYLGVLVALAGVMVLVYASGTSLSFTGALTAGIGLAALGCGYGFARAGGPAAMRAAGACLGLGAAAIGAGFGELSSAAAVFTRTVVSGMVCSSPGSCVDFTSLDHAGNTLFGASFTVAVVLALIRFVPGHVAAVVLVASAYTVAAASIDLAQLHNGESSGTIAMIIVVVSAGLGGVGQLLRGRQPAVSGLLDFVAVVGGTLPLFLLGGDSNLDLDFLGGLIAVLGLGAGITLARHGMAYGGMVGVVGLVIDIGARNFHTATSIGVFLSVCGALGVAAVVAVTRLLSSGRIGRHRRGNTAR